MPELFAAFYGRVRRELFGRLEALVRRRISQGEYRRVDPSIAARHVVETVTFFARHRFRDPDLPLTREEPAKAAPSSVSWWRAWPPTAPDRTKGAHPVRARQARTRATLARSTSLSVEPRPRVRRTDPTASCGVTPMATITADAVS